MGGIQIATSQFQRCDGTAPPPGKVGRQEGTKVRIRLKSQARGLTSGMESVSTAFIDLKEFHIA
jgi:hypothetical protein